jgi:gluconokinase
MSSLAVVIGLDLGTSKVKALAFTLDGREVGSASEEYPLRTPAPGLVEQDADAVYAAAMRALATVLGAESLRGADVRAIGLSSAMHGVVAVGRDGDPLGPLITWMDGRAADIADQWRADGTAQALYTRTGAPMHPMLPVCKLRWLSDHDPALFRRAALFVSMKELLVYRWVGEWLVDHGIASATGMFDVFTKQWNPRALDAARVTPERLARPVSPLTTRVGLRTPVAAALHLRKDVPVVLCSSDGALANLGVGALAPTDLAMTFGTSGAVRSTVREPMIDDRGRTFCYALDDERYIVGGPTSSAGASMQWVIELLYPEVPHEKRFEHALASMDRESGEGAGPLCLPFFAGERAPYWDARLRGAFVGLDLSHRREALVRAAAEGIVFVLYAVERVLEERIGRHTRMLLSGGLVTSPVIRRLVADVFGIESWLTDKPEASGFGAAMMAATAVGGIARLDDIAALVAPVEKITPHEALRVRYREKYERYEALTALLSGYYHSGASRPPR